MNTTRPKRGHALHTARSISLGALWRVLRYPFLMLSMIWIPPMMGVETYGRFALFTSVFLICEGFTGMGNLQIFGRFVPELDRDQPGASAAMLKAVMGYGLILTVVVVTIVLAGWRFMAPTEFPFSWVVILCLVLVLGKLQGTLFAFLYGENRIGLFSAREVMRSAFTLLFIIIGYKLFGLIGALWALAANEAALLAFSAWWTRHEWRKATGPVRWKNYWPLVLFGLRFYVPTFAFGLLQRSGNVFVQRFTGQPEQVSCFDIANQFLIVSYSFLNLILYTMAPSLTALHVRGRSDDVRTWQRLALRYCGALAFLAFHALMLLGQPILQYWLGPSFHGVFGNAVLISVSLAPLLLASVGTNYSLLAKEPGIYTLSVLAGLTTMAAGSWVLTPRWGAIGTAAATVMAYTAFALVLVVRYRKEMLHMTVDLLKVLLTGALLCPLYWLHGSPWVTAWVFAGSTALYIFLLFVFRLARLEHIRFLREAFAHREEEQILT